jgi:DNA helicase-2/ATP-dependent DNA helicase PcrA
MHLNSEQETVVSARDGVYAVIAGPGAGKSRCLIERYCRLVESGIKPEDAVTVTFTAEAARSLRKRVEQRGIDIQKTDRPSGFLTTHSLALSFATIETEHFPFKLATFPLATEGQAYKVLGEVCKRHEIKPAVVRPYISLQKGNRVGPEESLKRAEAEGASQAKALAYKDYERKMREMGVLDFDSLLVEMVNLLEKNAEVRDRWSFRYVMCDESQDNSRNQWELLQSLSRKHGNLLCVGDSGQGLYSFRGADPKMFLEMEIFFPECKKLFLATNHRSTSKIVDFLKIIGPVKELAEQFTTANEAGVEPAITQYHREELEAEDVARKIENGDPNHTAVLARTNRALRPIEDALSERKIKYYVQANAGFWSRPEVVSVLAYLQCAVSPHDNAVITALRAPYQPSRYLKKKQLTDSVKDLQKRDPRKPSLMSLLYHHEEAAPKAFARTLWGLSKYKDMPTVGALSQIMKEIKALDYYQQEEAQIDNSPVENLLELQKIAQRFNSPADLLAHARRAQAASRNRKGVCLTTCHSAKGLEFSIVFLIGAHEGLLPHARATSIEEEACVFFVACSRPQEELHISYVGTPSRFLAPFLPKEAV